jgi:hypothetical protein
MGVYLGRTSITPRSYATPPFDDPMESMLAPDSPLRGRNTSVLYHECGVGAHAPQPHATSRQAPCVEEHPRGTPRQRHTPGAKQAVRAGRKPQLVMSLSDGDLCAAMDAAPARRRLPLGGSEPDFKANDAPSYVESLCEMSHELHVHRCRSEHTDDLLTIMRTPSKALASLITPPASPLSAASTRPVASPRDLYCIDYSRSSDDNLLGKMLGAVDSLGWAVRTAVSLALWCVMLLLGLLLVLSFCAMSYDLARADDWE